MRWHESSHIVCSLILASRSPRHFAGKAEISITYTYTEKSPPSSGTSTERGQDFSVGTRKCYRQIPSGHVRQGTEETTSKVLTQNFSVFTHRNTSMSLKPEPR